MRKAAAYIVGTHDFKCFQAAGGEEKETTVRTIYRLDIDRRGDDVVIEISGDGFLYNMVRIITGTLTEVVWAGADRKSLQASLRAETGSRRGIPHRRQVCIWSRSTTTNKGRQRQSADSSTGGP